MKSFYETIDASGPIIIVDDDMDDHDLIKDVCDNLGVCNKLKFFQDGAIALDYLRTVSERPFIVLCDINMPEMSGLRLRRQMLDDKELRKKSIPFVFFSTAATDKDLDMAYKDLVVQGYFLKEHTFTELEDTLRIIFKYWAKCKYPLSM